VVIDNGSGVIKAGLAGTREPRFLYPNIVGRAKRVGKAAEGQELCVGDQAQDRRSSLSIRYLSLPGAGGDSPAGDSNGDEEDREASHRGVSAPRHLKTERLCSVSV
jgi:hypothetical protein